MGTSKFSDPAWWPQPPPQPPKPIATWKIVVVSVLTTLGVAAVVILIATHDPKKKTTAPVTKSIAAFTACVKAHGVIMETEQDGSKLQAAVDACRDRLPEGTQLRSFQPRPTGSRGRGEAYSSCMEAALANLPRPSRATIDSYRKAYQKASMVCRSLSRGNGAGTGQPPIQQTTPTTTTSSTPPIA